MPNCLDEETLANNGRYACWINSVLVSLLAHQPSGLIGRARNYDGQDEVRA